MKKYILFWLLVVGVIACTNDDTGEELFVCKDLISTSRSLQLQEDGQGMELAIKANCYWIVSSPASWVTITPSQGVGDGHIIVTAEKNPRTTERSCELIIKAGNAPAQVVVVTQSKASEEEKKEPGFDDNRPPS